MGSESFTQICRHCVNHTIAYCFINHGTVNNYIDTIILSQPMTYSLLGLALMSQSINSLAVPLRPPVNSSIFENPCCSTKSASVYPLSDNNFLINSLWFSLIGFGA